jgi:hypothetical protein
MFVMNETVIDEIAVIAPPATYDASEEARRSIVVPAPLLESGKQYVARETLPSLLRSSRGFAHVSTPLRFTAELVGAIHRFKSKVHSPRSVLIVTCLRGLQAITG